VLRGPQKYSCTGRQSWKHTRGLLLLCKCIPKSSGEAKQAKRMGHLPSLSFWNGEYLIVQPMKKPQSRSIYRKVKSIALSLTRDVDSTRTKHALFILRDKDSLQATRRLSTRTSCLLSHDWCARDIAPWSAVDMRPALSRSHRSTNSRTAASGTLRYNRTIAIVSHKASADFHIARRTRP